MAAGLFSSAPLAAWAKAKPEIPSTTTSRISVNSFARHRSPFADTAHQLEWISLARYGFSSSNNKETPNDVAYHRPFTLGG